MSGEGTLRVLVVDDDETTSVTLCSRLEAQGVMAQHTPSASASGRIAEEDFEVALIDNIRPDGDELARELKTRSISAELRVVLLTDSPRSDSASAIDACWARSLDDETLAEQLRALTACRTTIPAPKVDTCTVWVVSDDAAIRGLLAYLLERHAIETYEQSFEASALFLMRHAVPDAAVIHLDTDPGAALFARSIRDEPNLRDLVLVGIGTEGTLSSEVAGLFDVLIEDAGRMAELPARLQEWLGTLPCQSPREDRVASVERGDRLHVAGFDVGSVLMVRDTYLLADIHHAGAFLIPADAIHDTAPGVVRLRAGALDPNARVAIDAILARAGRGPLVPLVPTRRPCRSQ